MNKMHLQFYPKLIIRTPLNPYQTICDDKLLTEAIYIATPTFYHQYEKCFSKSSEDQRQITKLKTTLYKYKSRACSRCTPFGLFAAVSIGKWEDKTDICFDADFRKTLRRKTRLDMNVLCDLAAEISKKYFIMPFLIYYPNTSIYKVGNNYRYVFYSIKNKVRFYNLISIDCTDYLMIILEGSKRGLNREQLSRLLVDENIRTHEAEDFIDELIESQVLISELEPNLTGEDFLDIIRAFLLKIQKEIHCKELDQIIQDFSFVCKTLKNLDESVLNPISSYKLIFDKLQNHLPFLEETNLFQIDLFKDPISCGLDLRIQEEIGNVLQFLNKINPPLKNVKLENFKKRFYDRFGESEVQLLIALDSETGIGYPEKDIWGVNDLIDDLDLVPGYNKSNYSIELNDKLSILHKILIKASIEKKKSINISHADFVNIDYSSGDLPPTFSVMFKIYNSPENKIQISSISGISAVNLLSRFGHGDDELKKILEEICVFEDKAQPDRIIAEIVHLPENRTGNILARPKIRSFEIAYLAKSTAKVEFKIKMTDLYLKLIDNKIVLFDKRLNKEIIPRLSNAHNYSYGNSLPVYHFLGDLQTQYFSKSPMAFNWGAISRDFSFLPRVEFKNTILFPATWQITKEDMKRLFIKEYSNQQRINAYFDLKIKFELPDKFLFIDGDNELLIDSENIEAVNVFINLAKNRNSITINEFLFDKFSTAVRSTEDKPFTNEFIAIIFNKDNQKAKVQEFNKWQLDSVKKIFSIGSEWQYYKIYCGVKTGDFILIGKIKSLTELLLNKGLIDKWFFIRYGDPDLHIRFRLHVTKEENIGEIMLLINKEFQDLLHQNVISKISTDTYMRELERYGANIIEYIETLFYFDSVFVVNFISNLKGINSDTIRWQLSLLSIDSLLSDFDFSIEEKLKLVESLGKVFFAEHSGEKQLKIKLDIKFRRERKSIEKIMEFGEFNMENYAAIYETIKLRSQRNKIPVNYIMKINGASKLAKGIHELLPSIIHMNVNRFFMGLNRSNEFVAYELLSRYYKSRVAKDLLKRT